MSPKKGRRFKPPEKSRPFSTFRRCLRWGGEKRAADLPTYIKGKKKREIAGKGEAASMFSLPNGRGRGISPLLTEKRVNLG